AGAGYDSVYAGESVFTAVPAGSTGQMSAIFFNSGSQVWAPGVVGLLVCLADKTTCGVASPNAAYASNWYAPSAYATVTTPVSPGVSSSALNVALVFPNGGGPAIPPTVTVIRVPASALYCRITAAPGGQQTTVANDGSTASAVGLVTQFTVTSTTFPGQCDI